MRKILVDFILCELLSILCVCFLHVCFEGGILDLIAFIPVHALSFNFLCRIYKKLLTYTVF